MVIKNKLKQYPSFFIHNSLTTQEYLETCDFLEMLDGIELCDEEKCPGLNISSEIVSFQKTCCYTNCGMLFDVKKSFNGGFFNKCNGRRKFCHKNGNMYRFDQVNVRLNQSNNHRHLNQETLNNIHLDKSKILLFIQHNSGKQKYGLIKQLYEYRIDDIVCEVINGTESLKCIFGKADGDVKGIKVNDVVIEFPTSDSDESNEDVTDDFIELHSTIKDSVDPFESSEPYRLLLNSMHDLDIEVEDELCFNGTISFGKMLVHTKILI